MLKPHRHAEAEVTSTVEAPAAATCPNCDAPLAGRYCASCGEKRVEDEDYSLRHFLGETFNILTSVESNLFRSFATLAAKPGRLTTEYFSGRRKSYLKPLQLFLFCNLIFFFAQSAIGFNSLTTPLYVHLNMLPYSERASVMVNRELQKEQVTYESYRARFDAAIEGQAKTLVIVMVPVFALLMQLLYWRPRRYYAEHLVFATHFFAFFLLLLPALHLAAYVVWRATRAAKLTVPLLASDNFMTLLLLSICGVYLSAALRRAYPQGRVLTTAKCVVLVGSIMFVLQLYRFILFFTTFYSL